MADAASRLPTGLVTIVGVAPLLLLSTSAGLDLVTIAGRFVPPRGSLTADYAIGCLLAVAIGWVMYWTVPETWYRLPVVLCWLARAASTLGAHLLFEHRYHFLDTYNYFDLATTVRWSLDELGVGQGTMNVAWAAGLVTRIVGPSYHAIKVVYALVGFAGSWLLAHVAARATGTDGLRPVLVLLLFPSLLFWPATVGKEAPILLAIGLALYGTVAINEGRLITGILSAAAGIVLGALVRTWFGPLLCLPAVVGVLSTPRLSRTTKGALALAGGLVIVAFSQRFAVDFAVETFEDLVLRTESVSQAWAIGGSARVLAGQLTSPAEIVTFLPFGIFTALFRPLPGEVNNAFGVLAGVESVLLLAGAAVTIARLVRARRVTRFQAQVITVLLAWAALYSVVSFQNLGTAVRYRVPAVALLLLLWLIVPANPRPARG